MSQPFARRSLTAAITAATLSAVTLQAQAATEVTLGHTLSDSSHYSVGADAFKETLERLSDGEFIVNEHPSGSLGGERAMIEGLQIGTVDVVITSTGPLGNFVPDTYVLDLPFLFEDYDQARCVLDGEIGQELLTQMGEHDLVGLAWSENGFRHMTNSQREVNAPQDVEGLKVRTMENQVHQEAFRQLGRWQKAGLWPGPLGLGINISPRQFAQPGFLDQFAGLLEDSGVPGEWVKLEITENLLIQHLATAVEHMEALGHMGLSFAMDDFGTGYSSLAYLHQLPVSTLKIDRCFVQRLTGEASERRGSAAIIAAVTGLAQELSLRVVAEGVETAEQLAALSRYPVTLIQGYLTGRPVDAAAFERDWLRREASSPRPG